MDTVCEPNIMTLARVVLKIFCSQGSTGLLWESRKNIEKGLLLCNVKSYGKEKPEDHWSCIAHLSAENILKSVVIEEKKFKNIESE